MDQLLELLENINPDIDFRTADRLIDDGLLDSLSILGLVSDLEDAYGIEIRATDLVPKNFNSVACMWQMIQQLQKE